MIERMNGEYFFLSNFYEGKPFEFKGYMFTNVEAAFQSQKHPGDEYQFSKMRPSQAKKLGRNILLRNDWEKVKNDVMYEACKAKFSQDEELKQRLLDTGNEYIQEGNNHFDKIWGVIKQSGKWVGENRLGKILMKIREELRNQ